MSCLRTCACGKYIGFNTSLFHECIQMYATVCSVLSFRLSGDCTLSIFTPCPWPSLTQQVQLIVQNALRLYSQDRTGHVDYALESGGNVANIDPCPCRMILTDSTFYSSGSQPFDFRCTTKLSSRPFKT